MKRNKWGRRGLIASATVAALAVIAPATAQAATADLSVTKTDSADPAVSGR